MRQDISWYSLLTTDYAIPLLEEGKKHDEKIVLEQLGDLPDNF